MRSCVFKALLSLSLGVVLLALQACGSDPAGPDGRDDRGRNDAAADRHDAPPPDGAQDAPGGDLTDAGVPDVPGDVAQDRVADATADAPDQVISYLLGPPRLDLPDTAYPGSARLPLVISLGADAPEPLTSIARKLTGPHIADFQVEVVDCTFPLAPGDSCALEVVFTPPVIPGGRSADLELVGDPHSTLTVELRASSLGRVHNIAFVSSVPVPADLGGVAPYDAVCAQLASDAGLPGTYVAWMSDATSDARDRVTGRGWVRRDGLPFLDRADPPSQTGIPIFNPIRLDENGQPVAEGTFIFTGTLANGTAFPAQSCINWTSASLSEPVVVGSASGGPTFWTGGQAATCDVPRPILCMGIDLDAPLVMPPPTPGKRIFLSRTPFLPGGGLVAADAQCEAEKPPGTGAVKALLATTTRPASDVVDPAATYVRVDGQVVGTGAELIAGGPLRSGIWQDGAGDYRTLTSDYFAWTGSTNPGETGTVETTCNDWTSTAGFGKTGYSREAGEYWWPFINITQACASMGPLAPSLYCIEQ